MTPIQGLLLALAVEGPVVLAVALRAQGRRAFGTWLLLVAGANLVTYFPFVAAAAALRPRWGATAALILLESVVALLEGAIYARAGRLGWSRGLALAALANALSWGAGAILSPAL